MGVEFRVLGEVELLVGGHRVDIGHARQRNVLLALLIDADQVVSVDRLVERVWADRPPQRARGALYNYVSRLRRILAGGGDAAVVRRSGGYVLAVDPLAIDLYLFDDLTGRARAAADVDVAAGLFSRALGLWRGEAFATLDLPWLNSVRDTATNRRIAAELDHNDIELRRGRHHDLVPDLSARAAARPLDERLAGQLMLALYRCGRQADALEHYQRSRSRLAEDLGIDPAPALRELHQLILAGSPALDLRAPNNPPRTAPPPHQLPAPPRFFTGRRDELAHLDTILSPGHTQPTARVVVIAGSAGIGKTTLALHWAHTMAAAFPDGQLYVNLRGFDPRGAVMDPATAVRGFLDALGVPADRIPTDPDVQTGLYRSLMANRRMLVVLDNARDSEQVRPLLAGSAGSLVIATSRSQLASLVVAEGAAAMTLDLLTRAEAVDLLAGRLGADRVEAEPDAVTQIIDRCARLPLALAIAAARAVAHPRLTLARLAAQLRGDTGPLDALDGGEPAADARVVFSWSYRTLSRGAARLFRLLGLHPGPDVGRAAVASLAGIPPREVQAQLAELVCAHLVTEHSPDRYTFHDLLRAYAAELAAADADRNISTSRMLDHYLHTAFTAAMLLNPTRATPLALPPIDDGVIPQPLSDRAAAQQWFSTERLVLFTVIPHAADVWLFRHAWQLAWTVHDYCDWHGHWHSLLLIQEIAVAAARLAGDPDGQARAERGLGIANFLLGRYEPALRHLNAAFDRYQELGDEDGMAHCHHSLGVAYSRQQRYAEAEQHARSALAIYQRTGNLNRLPGALNQLGWQCAMLGNYQDTLTYCGQALTAAEPLGDQYVIAATWDSLGYAHHHLGDYTRAISCYQHSRELRHDLGDRYYESDTLIHLGEAYAAIGLPETARNAWHQAWEILRELDHPIAADVHVRISALDAGATR